LKVAVVPGGGDLRPALQAEFSAAFESSGSLMLIPVIAVFPEYDMAP